MIGFAQIKGGYPSSAKAMRAHLMNATLSPTEAQLAAYYQRGMVAEAHEVQLARRATANAAHFEAWVEGRAAPDLVRLAEGYRHP